MSRAERAFFEDGKWWCGCGDELVTTNELAQRRCDTCIMLDEMETHRMKDNEFVAAAERLMHEAVVMGENAEFDLEHFDLDDLLLLQDATNTLSEALDREVDGRTA